jgi:hypothetical protein
MMKRAAEPDAASLVLIPFLLESFMQAVVTTVPSSLPTSYNPGHLTLLATSRAVVTDILASHGCINQFHHRGQRVQWAMLEIARRTLMRLPIAVPRSPEALLSIRQELEPSLNAFRERITALALDMVAAGDDLPPDHQIEQLVTNQLTEPLRTLRDELSTPSSKYFGRLLRAETVATALVSMAHFLMPAVPAMGAASIATVGVAALQAAIARGMQVRDARARPAVGFLLQLVEGSERYGRQSPSWVVVPRK